MEGLLCQLSYNKSAVYPACLFYSGDPLSEAKKVPSF